MSNSKKINTESIVLCPVCALSMPPGNKYCSLNCYNFINNKISESEWMEKVDKLKRWNTATILEAFPNNYIIN